MIYIRPHTAEGEEFSSPIIRQLYSKEENFFDFLDYYNTLSDEKKIMFNNLFGYDDLNDMTKIQYEKNNFGFRSPYPYTFEEYEPSVWVFGDSISFGHGVAYENTWPYLLAKAHGLKLYNFSLPGKGIDSAIRIAEQWINNAQCKPKVVISYGYYADRYEISELLRNDFSTDAIKYYDTIFDDSITDLKLVSDGPVYQKKVEYLKELFNYYNVPFVMLDFLSHKDGWHNFYVDFARDLPIEFRNILMNTTTTKIYPHQEIFHHMSTPHPGKNSHVKMFEHINNYVKTYNINDK